MIVRKLRLQRGWSQETLAQLTGLSVRTIQRIERGDRAGFETVKSLAAVFDVDIALFQEQDMNTSTDTGQSRPLPDDEAQALKYVRDIKAFRQHLGVYLLVVAILVFVNLMTSPGHLWFLWPVFGWGIGVAVHGLSVHEVFNFLGPEWERREVERRLNRKL